MSIGSDEAGYMRLVLSACNILPLPPRQQPRHPSAAPPRRPRHQVCAVPGWGAAEAAGSGACGESGHAVQGRGGAQLRAPSTAAALALRAHVVRALPALPPPPPPRTPPPGCPAATSSPPSLSLSLPPSPGEPARDRRHQLAAAGLPGPLCRRHRRNPARGGRAGGRRRCCCSVVLSQGAGGCAARAGQGRAARGLFAVLLVPRSGRCHAAPAPQPCTRAAPSR